MHLADLQLNALAFLLEGSDLAVECGTPRDQLEFFAFCALDSAAQNLVLLPEWLGHSARLLPPRDFSLFRVDEVAQQGVGGWDFSEALDLIF